MIEDSGETPYLLWSGCILLRSTGTLRAGIFIFLFFSSVNNWKSEYWFLLESGYE